MFDWFINNLIGVLVGVSFTSLGFWVYFKPKIEESDIRFNLIENRINKVEDACQHGKTPEMICEACHYGVYSYKGENNYEAYPFSERWVCDKCQAEAPKSWKEIRIRKHRSNLS